MRHAPNYGIIYDMVNETSLLTSKELAQEIGVSQTRIRQMVADGTIIGVKRAKTWFFDRAQIDAAKQRNLKSGAKIKHGRYAKRESDGNKDL
jgi:hypothetical protein